MAGGDPSKGQYAMNIRSIGTLGVIAGVAAICLPALAGDKPETQSGPDPRIGEEVDSICFQRNINGWRAVKGEDDVVLLERGVNDWYRVELLGACDERLFRFAQKIAIESRPAGGCLRRYDYIIVEDTPGFNRRCSITRMYKWDEDAVAPDETETNETSDEGA